MEGVDREALEMLGESSGSVGGPAGTLLLRAQSKWGLRRLRCVQRQPELEKALGKVYNPERLSAGLKPDRARWEITPTQERENLREVYAFCLRDDMTRENSRQENGNARRACPR